MTTSMRIIGTLGLATLFALGAGCKKEAATGDKKEEKGTDKGGSDLVKAYNDLADEVCKCADTKCVNDVQTKATDLAGKMSGTTPSEEDQKAIADATAKWAKCAEEIAKKEAGAGGTEGGGAEAVKAYQDLADSVCACKDAQCVADAQGKASELASKVSGFTPTAEEAQAIAAAGEKMAKCVQDITAGGGATGGTTGGTEGGAAAGSADDFVKQYNELADAVCACKDTNCLMEAMQKAQDLGTKAGEMAASMTPEQGQAVAAASQKMSDCASKITGAGGGQ